MSSALVRRAIEAKILDAQAAHPGRLTITEHSRTHIVRVVALDDTPVAVVKHAGLAAQLDGDDPITAENHALRLLADSGLVPHLLPVHDPQAVWTEPIHPGRSLNEWCSPLPAPDLAAAWGMSLARLHRWPTTRASIVPRAPRPWVLDLPTGARPMHLSHSSTAADVLDDLTAEPAVVVALQSAAAHWHAAEKRWIHGDATTANAIARRDYAFPFSDPRWRVWLIDLEFAGLGDPAWDLATAVDSLELAGWRSAVDPGEAVSALLLGYEAAGGIATLDAHVHAARAVLSATASAAWAQSRPASVGADRAAERLVQRARELSESCTTEEAASTATTDDASETACAGAWR